MFFRTILAVGVLIRYDKCIYPNIYMYHLHREIELLRLINKYGAEKQNNSICIINLTL
jgi:hypothetical protein